MNRLIKISTTALLCAKQRHKEKYFAVHTPDWRVPSLSLISHTIFIIPSTHMPQEHFKLDHHEFLPQPIQFII